MLSGIAFWSLTTLAFTALYCSLIAAYWYFWNRLPQLKPARSQPDTLVSVLIVGRNEEKNIPACLRSIEANDYPKKLYEIIFVDDHSEDGSLTVLQSLGIANLVVIRLKDHLLPDHHLAYKKMAIELAIRQAKGTLLLQTDADTRVGEHWIRDHVKVYEQQSKVFTTGPVFIQGKNTVLNVFQKLDFIVNMGMTGAGIQSGWHYMANGANMSYSRKAYQAVDLSGTKNLASGDDMFLVQALAIQYPGKISFLKSPDSLVLTNPEPDFKSFFRQRIRWASKTGKYRSPSLLITAVLVFLVNFFLISNLVLIFWHPAFLYLFSITIFLKWVMDYSFIRSVSSFYKIKIEPWEFLLSSLLYPFYFVIIGFMSVFVRQYLWKGRKIP